MDEEKKLKEEFSAKYPDYVYGRRNKASRRKRVVNIAASESHTSTLLPRAADNLGISVQTPDIKNKSAPVFTQEDQHNPHGIPSEARASDVPPSITSVSECGSSSAATLFGSDVSSAGTLVGTEWVSTHSQILLTIASACSKV